MELPCRRRDDVYLPDGALRAALERLRQRTDAHALRIGIVNAFDFRTRMLPYWYADRRMAPCSVRTLADVLAAAGFRHVRVVLQQWTPNFRPGAAVLDGRPLDLLLVSALQVHAEPAYALIRDACRLGAARPLIVAGGPKAIYEPTDYFELGPDPGVGADCVVTGEAFVLLDLLEALLREWDPGRSLRSAFTRARRAGALEAVPGLVYLAEPAAGRPPTAINTGVQRLLRDLDELPLPDAGFRLLERPHRGRGLRPAPCPAAKVRRHSPIASILVTQGCRFRCPYCPISAVNQRTWRHKSPGRFAAEIRHIHEQFGIRSFFGTDDNFFNRRETAVALLTELAATTTRGVPLRKRMRFYTEATQTDVFRNRDLLPLCRQAGLRGFWFGVEDLTAELVQKGQSAAITRQLFALMHRAGIQPHVMMIHSDAQPLRSPPGQLAGLLNQARYLFDHGAVSYQCTYLGPAIGTRDLEPALRSGAVFRRVGGRPVPQACQDGNHVVASRHPRPWQRQLNLLRAYLSFYNPGSALQALLGFRRHPLFAKRAFHQLIGHLGLFLTVPKLLYWAWRLKRGPIEVWEARPRARFPMRAAGSGQLMNWAIEQAPWPEIVAPPRRAPQRVVATT